MTVEIWNQTKNTQVASEVVRANRFTERTKGLLGRSGLSPGEAMLIEPAASIHTLFMKFRIDVVFLDKNMNVLKIIEELKPWRLTTHVRKSRCVLELPIGTIADSKTQVGDRLEIRRP